MNNAQQEMSPDFVLMRLVSAAEEEDGRLEAENGNIPAGGAVVGMGKDVLAHGGGKSALDISRDPTAGLELNKGRPSGGESAAAPAEGGGTEGRRTPPSPRAQRGNPMETQGFGLRPQLLVFSNIMRNGEGILDLEHLNTARDALERGPVGGSSSSSSIPAPGDVLLDQRPAAAPLLSDRAGAQQDAVLELARRFGELGVGQCSCQGAQGSAEPREDPTETSDALLVLEGLGSRDIPGLAMEEGLEDDEGGHRELLLKRKREIMQKMSGTFSISSFQVELRTQVEEMSQVVAAAGSEGSAQVLPPQNSPGTTTSNPSQASTPRRAKRCTSVSRTPYRPAGGEKAFRVPGKSKKNSLKTRLSKLFRTKSCSGSTHILDNRPSVSYSVSSAMSLVDMEGASGAQQDADRVPRLTRAHSAFSPASLTASLSASLSTFTGETVSLVDVDISLTGRNTPHPPTPPRRSLSLLDAFLRALPHANPLPSNAVPTTRQATAPVLCALRRSEASNFTASLRELEKCGWYWGPMNWEDAEVKLKGKLDGSFLVRDSSDPRYILSLSFRSQGITHHTRMEHYRGTFSLWCHPKFEDRCHSVVEFIERAIMHSKNGKFLYFLRSRVPGLPPTPVQLLYPVSRFSNVKSLQHLCRFCIRQIVRIDHIQELPLPRSLISYLSKFYYYDPEEEMYLSISSIRRVVGAKQEANPQT